MSLQMSSGVSNHYLKIQFILCTSLGDHTDYKVVLHVIAATCLKHFGSVPPILKMFKMWACPI